MNSNKRIYLTGYQSETVEGFIAKLKRYGISHVIDVRELPLSRKNGFSKAILTKALMDKGIKYTHMRSLGTPRPIRIELKKNGNYINFFNKYRAYVRNKHIEIQKIITLSRSETACVLCFEKDCKLCHRSIIADEVLKASPSAKIIPV